MLHLLHTKPAQTQIPICKFVFHSLKFSREASAHCDEILEPLIIGVMYASLLVHNPTINRLHV